MKSTLIDKLKESVNTDLSAKAFEIFTNKVAKQVISVESMSSKGFSNTDICRILRINKEVLIRRKLMIEMLKRPASEQTIINPEL